MLIIDQIIMITVTAANDIKCITEINDVSD